MLNMRQSCIVVLAVVGAVALPSWAQPAPQDLALPDLSLPSAAPANAGMPIAGQPAASPPPLPTGPTVGVQPATSGAPIAPSPAPAGVQEKPYSYGSSSISVLFLPEQIERMKGAIRSYEGSDKLDKPSTLVAPEPIVVTAPVAEVIQEPTAYPAFFLSSIVYRSPNDWSVWMGGEKITPQKNETDVSIVRVAPDSVTFAWAPAYSRAINQRQKTDSFAPTDLVKNKLARDQNARLDEAAGRLTFTLKQNQTFVVGYFKTFEGFVEAPTLEPVPQIDPAAAANFSAGAVMAFPSAPPPMTSAQPVQPQSRFQDNDEARLRDVIGANGMPISPPPSPRR